MNAYGHGIGGEANSPLVTSCGQYKSKDKLLKLTVLDFGQGIVTNVKKYLRDQNMHDVDAFKWALKKGCSTKTDSLNIDIPRGLGLDLLIEFVKVNKGSLTIASNSCYVHINSDEEMKIGALKVPFQGAMVNITINCDDRHYLFMSENTGEQYF